jgi:hypothetical protein
MTDTKQEVVSEGRLTISQVKVLTNAAAGRRLDYGFDGGRSVAGGLSGTYASLHRRGYLLAYAITEAGRLALTRAKEPSNG